MRQPNTAARRPLVVLLALALALTGCPAAWDGSEAISGGYELTSTGSDGTFITYVGPERPRTIVIDARVDAFKVAGQRILVARRPLVRFLGQEFEGKALRHRLLPICEHWVIDTATHEVRRTGETGGLLCR